MKNFYFSFFLFCSCLHATAQFSGNFAPAKWSTVLTPGSNGSVNTSSAPTSITINGSNDPTEINANEMNTDYTVTVNTAGIWRFDWTYHTNDSDNDPRFDIAGVLVDGIFTQLTSNNAGLTNQSGTYSANVGAATTIGFRISATDNIMGDATFTITNFSAPASVLPITVTSFAAKQQNDKVVLQWTTGDESNISGFDIERSSNDNRFTKITSVAARNLQDLQQYETVDATPLPGTAFYRLRIREMSGLQHFSSVAVVKQRFSGIQIYPNPVRSNLAINFLASKPALERVDIIDAAGRILQSKTFNVKTGQNYLHFENLPSAKGIYYLKTQTQTLPFTKE